MNSILVSREQGRHIAEKPTHAHQQKANTAFDPCNSGTFTTSAKLVSSHTPVPVPPNNTEEDHHDHVPSYHFIQRAFAADKNIGVPANGD